MSQAPLVALIQAHRDALARAADSMSSGAEATILGILQALERGEMTQGHAQRLLGQQALLATDEPTRAARYRQAASEIRQLHRAHQ